jgi:hypothetical protein
MKSILGAIMLLNVYIIVYYRLMVRHYYEQAMNAKESTFGALFSLPPYKSLPEKGKKYARKYWLAILLMFCCIGYLALTSQYSAISALASPG